MLRVLNFILSIIEKQLKIYKQENDMIKSVFRILFWQLCEEQVGSS